MGLSYSQQQKIKQERAKKARAEKDASTLAAHTAVNALLKKALRGESYTLDERHQISLAVRALDSVVGGWCNDRRR